MTLACLLLIPSPSTEAAQSPYTLFRVGFSHSLFEVLNENDARAAISVWAKTLARQKNIPTEPQALLFNNLTDIDTALHNKTVDLLAVSILEYELLQRQFSFGTLLVPTKNDTVGEEYLLVAHREGPVQNLSDLAGRKILFHRDPHQCLAPLWLDNLLVKRGFAPINSFVGKIGRNDDLAQVLLPVFFKQADACVVSRNGLEMSTELNPQLGRQLTVLETSARIVPIVLAFRQDFAPPFKEDLLEVLHNLHETEEGRQILTMLTINKLVMTSKTSLASALELISSYSRIINN